MLHEIDFTIQFFFHILVLLKLTCVLSSVLHSHCQSGVTGYTVVIT
jgi:hypothetical protein